MVAQFGHKQIARFVQCDSNGCFESRRLSRAVDGSSNTILFGEKAMAQRAYGAGVGATFCIPGMPMRPGSATTALRERMLAAAPIVAADAWMESWRQSKEELGRAA